MRSGDARMARPIAIGGADLEEREGVIENRIGLTRVVDNLNGAVPNVCDRPRIANRHKW